MVEAYFQNCFICKNSTAPWFEVPNKGQKSKIILQNWVIPSLRGTFMRVFLGAALKSLWVRIDRIISPHSFFIGKPFLHPFFLIETKQGTKTKKRKNLYSQKDVLLEKDFPAFIRIFFFQKAMWQLKILIILDLPICLLGVSEA